MTPCEQVLVDLIHDLRQPLGNIGTIAYCLDRCIEPGNARAQQYLHLIQQQVDQAVGMLSAASAELARAGTERAEPIAPAAPLALAAAAAR